MGLKVTELTELAVTPDGADILVIIDDPAGTPISKKITVANLHKAPVFTGAVTIPTINLTGGQIAFPATAVPSADPNTLDDYEEGTWTPAITFGGAAVGVTYDAATGGFYTIIGNIITLVCYIELANKGTSIGAAAITALPATVFNSSSNYAPVATWLNAVSFVNQFESRVVKGTTTINLHEITEAGVLTGLSDADFVNNSIVSISVTYRMA